MTQQADLALDLAQMVLRAGLGLTMIAHGIRHGRTLDGTASWFSSIGFRQPRLQAQLSSLVEAGAGVAVLLGLATPLAAAAIVATMAVAYWTVHRPNGYFVVAEGWEYVGFIAVAAVILSLLGPGSLSADALVGFDGPGLRLAGAAVAVGLGLIGAAGQLATFWTKPATKDEENV